MSLCDLKYMAKKQVKKGSSVGAMIGLGAGIAAATAAAYMMYGPDAKKNRKIVKSWALKMKGEIAEKFENAKELTEPVYHDILNKAQAKYSALKNVDTSEVEGVVAEIRKHWKSMTATKKPKAKAKKK